MHGLLFVAGLFDGYWFPEQEDDHVVGTHVRPCSSWRHFHAAWNRHASGSWVPIRCKVSPSLYLFRVGGWITWRIFWTMMLAKELCFFGVVFCCVKFFLQTKINVEWSGKLSFHLTFFEWICQPIFWSTNRSKFVQYKNPPLTRYPKSIGGKYRLP